MSRLILPPRLRSGLALPNSQRGFMLVNPARFGGSGGFTPGPPDPNFANVVSLCHFQGASGSTTFTDQIAGTSWTAGGGAQISTAQPLFGTSSLFMTANNDKITSNSDSRFAMGTGDFTLEFSVYIAGSGLGSVQSNLIEYVGASLAIYYAGNTTLRLFAAGADRITGGSLVQGAYNRIGLSRVSGVTRLALGGTVLGTYADANNYTATQFDMIIGNGGAATPPAHYFAELRITKGVGRFSANYTPSTTPFGDSA